MISVTTFSVLISLKSTIKLQGVQF